MLHQAAKLSDPQLLGTVTEVVALPGIQAFQPQLFIGWCRIPEFSEYAGDDGLSLTDLPAVFES